jgi:hypothetical protein
MAKYLAFMGNKNINEKTAWGYKTAKQTIRRFINPEGPNNGPMKGKNADMAT